MLGNNVIRNDLVAIFADIGKEILLSACLITTMLPQILKFHSWLIFEC